jgi:HAD superfamily hydrolase (TIGR01509 family)
MTGHFFKAVIFDLDGVLIHSEPLHCKAWEMTLQKYDFVFEDNWFDKWFGLRDTEISKLLVTEKLIDTEADLVLNQKRAAYRNLRVSATLVYPGIKDALLSLNSIPLALSTSSCEDDAYYVLKQESLLPLFAAVVTGDDVENGKPAPDCYELAAKKLAVPANQCLAVEDSVAGIQSARAAGMTVFGIVTTMDPSSMPEVEMTFPTTVEAISHINKIMRGI